MIINKLKFSVLFCGIFLLGCQDEIQTIEYDTVNDVLNSSTLAEDNVNQQQEFIKAKARSLEERLNNSHAMFAADTKFMCPKLVFKPVDDNRITRTDDVMKNDICRYYIYPEQGQSISAFSNNDALDIVLTTPYVHDFDNGPYIVKDFDKHIISVTYDSTRTKPDDFTYDLEIIIN